MTYAKITEFDENLQEMSQIAKLLSHPARLAILNYLAETKTCISGDIANELPLSRTTVSQHLQELKKGGLIKGDIDGNKVNYCLNVNSLNQAKQKLARFFEKLDIKACTDC